MLALVGLEQVNIAYVVLKKEGITLFGFLLYTQSDRAVIDYLQFGTMELDVLSGPSCTVFILEPPSPEWTKEWITYSRQNNHPWMRIIGKSIIDKEKMAPQVARKKPSLFERLKLSLLQIVIINNNSNTSVAIGDGNVVGDDNSVSLTGIIEPKINSLYNRVEALNVAQHLGISYTELPCLVLFKELQEKTLWKRPLESLRTQNELKIFFREFFASTEFTALVSRN